MANHQTSASCFSTSVVGARNTNYIYDVFINHRGPDVKKTLASHIYRRLVERGIRVFLDQSELQAGENLTCQIEGAIATASVHIAIFSPKYAESKWCLDELLLMLNSGATIIPVFYYVQPRELRWTQGKDGVYAQALRCLEQTKRYEPKIVENWRGALCRVAEISGLELEACNWDEGELVDKVVQRVQRNLRKTPLHVATYPTGLDDKLQDFENTISLQSGEVNAVGIVGLGGIGKTTLIKEFFNRKRLEYDQSCFLFDVREAAARSNLPTLQNKLIKDLISSDPNIDSVADGIEKLSRCLSCSAFRHFIILDDVDDVQQMDALFSPVKDVLRSGSLILVTSRNKDVLATSGIRESSIYKLTGLNTEHSQELFCSHAFHQLFPVIGFEEVVGKFLDACQGLPLSIKVIGALLYSESPDLESWEAHLNKISKVLPRDIQSRLKISYDNLDEEEKGIFLDAACFFIGEDKDKAIRIWDGSGWAGSTGLRNLENRCLVEVDWEHCIRMHDHIRDLGRALAEKDSPRRLWRLNDDISYSVVPQSYVRGLKIDTSALSSDNPVEIGNVRGLQMLMVEGHGLESLSNLLRQSKLLWLRWDFSQRSRYPPLHSLPSSISLKNLRVLEVVGYGPLETLWEDEGKAPLELRELNVKSSYTRFRLPKSIGRLKHLEKIELTGLVKHLPKEFFDLRSLKYLRMSTSLELLPYAFGNLTKLEILVINCPLRRAPFGRVKNIGGKYVSADQSGRRLLDSSVHKCMFLRLKQLDLHRTQLKKLSFAEGVCPNLRQLDISNCFLLVEVGALPTTLISLDLNNCAALKKVTGLCGLAKLQELGMGNCKAVEELPGLETLASLVHLRVSGCIKLKSIRGLAQATNLIIPDCFNNKKSDWIELLLYKDLRVFKERSHELQLKGEDFRWGSEVLLEVQDNLRLVNELQLEGEDIRWGDEQQLDTETFVGEGKELQLEGEDFRLGNELQLEVGDIFRWSNGLHLEGEHFRRGNELQLQPEFFKDWFGE